MKVNILNNHEVVLVDVPEGSKLHHIETTFTTKEPYLGYKFRDDELVNEYENIMLPPGEWSILGLGTASQCSGEEAKGIAPMCEDEVSDYRHYFFDYVKGNWDADDALESLHSYIRANGHQPETCVIVIRKKN